MHMHPMQFLHISSGQFNEKIPEQKCIYIYIAIVWFSDHIATLLWCLYIYLVAIAIIFIYS